MIRMLLLSLSLLAVAGCCHDYELQHPAPPPPPPVENEAKKIDAAESQLKMAETTGWDGAQQRAFSANLITLPLKTRIDYQQRLARALTFGQIKLKRRAPPPENVPACPCGANICPAPPITAVPAPADRVK